jgi:hypothetical protein
VGEYELGTPSFFVLVTTRICEGLVPTPSSQNNSMIDVLEIFQFYSQKSNLCLRFKPNHKLQKNSN